ncbi:MAG: Spy/CpxP family protein refolding chaperone [Candidatus Korobacteraceae bacterium]
MLKIVAAGVAALFVTASPLAYAQTPAAAATPSAADWGTLTDTRIDIVKAALQLTADQEKYWPAIDDAIHARAKNRQARIADAPNRVDKLRGGNALEVLRNRDPIDFLQRRADALAQRSADLKKLAGAWEPLYKTLSPDQKRRMAFLTLYVLHEVMSAAEQRLEGDEED